MSIGKKESITGIAGGSLLLAGCAAAQEAIPVMEPQLPIPGNSTLNEYFKDADYLTSDLLHFAQNANSGNNFLLGEKMDPQNAEMSHNIIGDYCYRVGQNTWAALRYYANSSESPGFELPLLDQTLAKTPEEAAYITEANGAYHQTAPMVASAVCVETLTHFVHEYGILPPGSKTWEKAYQELVEGMADEILQVLRLKPSTDYDKEALKELIEQLIYEAPGGFPFNNGNFNIPVAGVEPIKV